MLKLTATEAATLIVGIVTLTAANPYLHADWHELGKRATGGQLIACLRGAEEEGKAVEAHRSGLWIIGDALAVEQFRERYGTPTRGEYDVVRSPLPKGGRRWQMSR